MSGFCLFLLLLVGVMLLCGVDSVRGCVLG